MFCQDRGTTEAIGLIEIFRHHAEDHVESGLEDIHTQVFVDAMNVEHTGGDAAAVESLAGEDIGVAAAAADQVARLDALGLDGVEIQLIEEAFRIRLSRGIIVAQLHFRLAAELFGSLLAGGLDQVQLMLKFFLAVRTDFRSEKRLVRHHVGHAAAFDAAYV